MAKFKPPGSKKARPPGSNRGLIPCVFLLVTGFAIIFLLFYLLLKSGS
jgi:hypothetical protein